MKTIQAVVDDWRLRLPKSPQDATWTCELCGQPVPPIIADVPLGEGEVAAHYIRRRYCTCPAATEARQAREASREKDQRIQRALQMLIAAGLQTRGKLPTFLFSRWQFRSVQDRQVFEVVNRYVDTVEQGERNWLYLYGPPGLGKTHLAVAAVRKLCGTRLWRPCVVNWTEHCDMVKESWGANNGPTERQLWGQMRTADVLLIDDLDKNQPTPWAMRKLYTVVNYRWERQRATIITANNSLLELEGFWLKSEEFEVRDKGGAIASRISGQLREALAFSGEDRRWLDGDEELAKEATNR